VLVKLGADLNRVRQQVIQLLPGYQGKEPVSAGTGRGSRLADDVPARMDALDRRLAAAERSCTSTASSRVTMRSGRRGHWSGGLRLNLPAAVNGSAGDVAAREWVQGAGRRRR